MANYTDTFSSYSTGSLPTEWTEGWDASSNFTVETGGDDKILKCTSSSDSRKICTLDSVDSDGNRDNVEVLALCRSRSISSLASGGLVARATGTGTTENGYVCGIGGVDGNNLYVTKYVNAAATTVVDSANGLTVDTWYWIRFRVNSTSIKARVWAKADSEPGTWAIDTTDSSVTGTGRAGVFCFSGASDMEYESIAIATNGDAASFTETHSASGTMSGGGAAVSGASSVEIKSSGSITAGGAAVAGSAEHTPSGQSTYGDLLGGGAVVAGSATLQNLHATSGTLSGSGAAIVGAASNDSIIIYDTDDRGTLDLTGCSVTPNGTTPTINIKNQYASEDNAAGAANCFFHVTGVNGLRPVFDVSRTNMSIKEYTGKFKWSYTGEIGTWTDFTSTTRVTTPDVYRSQHADAFTQDTVYVSMANPWRIGYTLPWIQSLESSGYVSYAPSGGTSYKFETRSATSDHQGVAIAAQPLYSFRISSGAGNAPDGNPKRKLVMMSGVHASEDVGNYALKGAVEFLISSDPLAISVRSWFDAFVYPVVAAAGRAGGAQRGDFHAALKSADVNRAWDGSPALEVVTKHKTAIGTDAGSVVHVFMDFHGDRFTSVNTSYFEGTAGDPYGAKWDTAIDTYQVTSINYSASAEYSSGWVKANKACNYNLTPECGYLNEWTTASKESFGAAHIKAISYLIGNDEFLYHDASGSLIGGAAVLSGSASLTQNIAMLPLRPAATANRITTSATANRFTGPITARLQ